MRKTMYKDEFQSEMSDSFSYAGSSALFDFLEENYPDYEFDEVELRCDYVEYANMEEFNDEYPGIRKNKIEDHTTFIDIDGESFIIGVF